MPYSDTVTTVRSSWLASAKTTFTVFEPDFDQGASLQALTLGHLPVCRPRLRFLSVTAQAQLDCPRWFPPQTLAPGLHYFFLPQLNAELHLWVGSLKSGLQEFCGQFDAVLHADSQRLYARRLHQAELLKPTPGSVAVVGAGIAGSSVALALCQRGVPVDLYDSASAPATGASGNWVGAFHPHITRGDSPLSKLSRLGFQHTLQALQSLTELGLLKREEDWDTPGHLQTVAFEDADRTRDTLAQLNFPSTLVQWREPGEVLPGPLGGLYFPQGGWVKPARWVQANLQACAGLLRTHYNSKVLDLAQLRSSHRVVVLCCAEQSVNLAPISGARVGVVKGQITKLRSTAQPKVVLSGESYAIAPPHENWLVLGATYERPVVDLDPTAQADALNIARFKAAFPEWPLGEVLENRCALRFVWHDRLPAIGPVPDMPGVYMSTGFASRGLLWAALGGWMVANHCVGWPFESRLLGRIQPRGAT